MTREEYYKYLRMDDGYKGKHFKKYYNIYRVANPNSPVENFTVLGIDKAVESIIGYFDYSVTNTEGKIIPASLLFKYIKSLEI